GHELGNGVELRVGGGQAAAAMQQIWRQCRRLAPAEDYIPAAGGGSVASGSAGIRCLRVMQMWVMQMWVIQIVRHKRVGTEAPQQRVEFDRSGMVVTMQLHGHALTPQFFRQAAGEELPCRLLRLRQQ